MRLAGTKLAANHQYRGFGDQLYDLSGQRPSLDLNFSSTKSLVDSTTGQNLVTFTRASSGTYVDSQGVIQRATTNLKTFSENFSDASYSVSTRLTVTSDALAAPNGTVTADKLVATSNNDQKFVETTASVTSGLAYVFGMFAKKAEYEVLQISVANTNFSGTLAYANFNLDSGSIVSSVDCTPVIQTIGDGWYRCSVIMAAATSTGTNAFRFSPYSSGNPGRLASYTGDGTSGIFTWGAQLEQSSTVGEYIPTTSTINSAPRFDHSPTTSESLGLLVEESRTNNVLQSEDFVTTWTASSLTVTTNSVVAPDGTTTADTISPPTDGLTPTRFLRQNPVLTTQQAYTFSVFVKVGTATTNGIALYVSDNTATNNFRSNFNLFNLTTNAAGTGWATPTATIVPYPNGWYRCILSGVTSTAHASLRAIIFLNTFGNTADTYGSIHIWGAQLEAGSFPTSYIPTTTAAVTRSADVASITGTNFSSWYRQDEGTVFAEAASIQNGGRYFMFDDGVINDRWEARYNSWLAQLTSWKAGSADVTINTNIAPTSPALNVKIAAANKSNDAAIASNGIGNTVGTDNTSSMPSAQSRFWIGSFTGTATYANGTIRRLTYFPVRLPNETLQRITQ